MRPEHGERISRFARSNMPSVASKRHDSTQFDFDEYVQVPAELSNPPLTALAARLLQQLMLSGDPSHLNQLVESVKAHLKLVSGVPTNFSRSFQNESITQCLTSAIAATLKSMTCDSTEALNRALQTLASKPLVHSAFLCLFRTKAILQLKNQATKYRFMVIGNEEAFLSNYECEIRGNCLQLVMDAVGTGMSIKVGSEVESYGPSSTLSSLKLEMDCSGGKWFMKNFMKTLNASVRAQRKLDSERSSSMCKSNSPQRKVQQSLLGLGIFSLGTRENLPTSRFRCCNLCGKEKKERFCECRKVRGGKQNENNA